MFTIIIGAVLAYLLGSIPSAVWYGRIFHNTDIRNLGSGNAGATNTLRNLGKTAGIVVLLADALKGYLATQLAYWLPLQTNTFSTLPTLALLFGLVAVIGHIFPIFAGFRGGKGVATALGVIIAVLPLAALISISIFAITLLLTRYVSLGSILAAISFPISAFFLCPNEYKITYVVLGSLLALLIIIKHKKNIDLLISGQENKIGKK